MSAARVMRPDRRQLRWDMVDLERLLPADHRARIVWSFVESLDLSELYERVKSRDGEAGRTAADPAVMLALWLNATVEGVGSARALERLAESDAAYRWLAGGVPLNYHGLADFRGEQVEVLDRLLTQSVTALIGEGLTRFSEIAVDGTKIRASASKGSFKTGEKLLKIEAAVAERLTALKQELTDDPGASSRRRQATRERGRLDVVPFAGRGRIDAHRTRRMSGERNDVFARGVACVDEQSVGGLAVAKRMKRALRLARRSSRLLLPGLVLAMGFGARLALRVKQFERRPRSSGARPNITRRPLARGLSTTARSS